MPLETLKAFLEGTEPNKDTKSLYVVESLSLLPYFPGLFVTHEAEWTGRNPFIFYNPKKVYTDCKIESLHCHYNKKESLLTLKIKLYKPKSRMGSFRLERSIF
jgi:hypothetical protein